MSNSDKNFSIASHENMGLGKMQKLGLALGFVGLFILLFSFLNVSFTNKTMWFYISIISVLVGIVIYANATYLSKPEGISNNGVYHKSISNRGLVAWIIGVILTAFYVVLYWFPKYLGLGENGATNTGIVGFFDNFSLLMNGKAASQWFVYGTLYTVAILGFGFKFILKYRHNKYQLVRTISVMFFQLGFAFLIPEILEKLNPESIFCQRFEIYVAFKLLFFPRLASVKYAKWWKFGNVYVGFWHCYDFYNITHFDLFLWQTLVLLLGLWLWRIGRNSWRRFPTLIK